MAPHPYPLESLPQSYQIYKLWVRPAITQQDVRTRCSFSPTNKCCLLESLLSFQHKSKQLQIGDKESRQHIFSEPRHLLFSNWYKKINNHTATSVVLTTWPEMVSSACYEDKRKSEDSSTRSDSTYSYSFWTSCILHTKNYCRPKQKAVNFYLSILVAMITVKLPSVLGRYVDGIIT